MKRLVLIGWVLMALLVMAGLSGCTKSIRTVQKHLDEMVEIGESKADNCDAMGKALNEYMDKYENSIRNSIYKKSNATEEEANLMYTTSLKLHNIINKCQTNDIERYKLRLSLVVMQEAMPKSE